MGVVQLIISSSPKVNVCMYWFHFDQPNAETLEVGKYINIVGIVYIIYTIKGINFLLLEKYVFKLN